MTFALIHSSIHSLCIQIGRLSWQPFRFLFALSKSFACSPSPAYRRISYRIYFMCSVCIHRYVNLLFNPSHQPVNILLMLLANTYFFLFFWGGKICFPYSFFFLKKILLTCDSQLAFVIHVNDKKMGRLFFLCFQEPRSKRILL